MTANILDSVQERHPAIELAGRHPLAAYVLLAFGFSWAWWVPLAVAGRVVRPGSGEPTHFPGLLGPLLAALAVTALTGGRSGVRTLVVRLV